jgi:Sec-independent protein secretion pathway component TatC
MDVGGLAERAVHHLGAVRRLLLKACLLFGVLWFILCFIPLTPRQFGQAFGWDAWLYGAVTGSVAVDLSRWLVHWLTAPGEVVIVTGPWDGFSLVMGTGAAIAAIPTIAYLTSQILPMVDKGLYPSEKRAVRKMLTAAVGLFALGFSFALFVILPPLYRFSLVLQLAIGAAPTVDLAQLVLSALQFSLMLGLGFELPVIIWAAGVAKLVTSDKLRSSWRNVAGGSIILALVISPGAGGGIVEIGIAILLFGLYYLGYLLVKREERLRNHSAVTEAHGATD